MCVNQQCKCYICAKLSTDLEAGPLRPTWLQDARGLEYPAEF